MKIQVLVVLSPGKRETVEFDVEPDSKVRGIKSTLSKQFGLIADDLILEKAADIRVSGLEELRFNPRGMLEHTGNDASIRTHVALDEEKTLTEQSVSSVDELFLK